MIFIIRHGETDFNRNHLIQGSRVDPPLNEKGKKQAKERSKIFDGISFDAVISSPLKRAVQTAQILTENAQVGEFKIDDRFIERSFGPLDGKLTPAKSFNYYFQDIEGAEDPEKLYKRILNALKDISRQYTGNILIVTHGGLSGSYVWYQTGKDNFKLFNLGCIIVDPLDCHLISFNAEDEEIEKFLKISASK